MFQSSPRTHSALMPRPPYLSRLPIVECLWVLLSFLLAGSTLAQDTGTLKGQVTTADGGVVTDARIDLIDLRLRANVDDEGRFQFNDLPAGKYLIRVESRISGDLSRRVVIEPGATTEVELPLEVIRHEDEVVVTASGIARSQLELAQTTTVLTGEDLQFRQQNTLGDTLAEQPGMTSGSFGPGAGRPVIRGIGGDRVRMLHGGVDAGDASSTSPDHAVTTDPALASRIEVLRGPSTLLYGSSAIGGVVNVEDDSIPSRRVEEPVTGFLDIGAGSVAEEKSLAASLTGGGGDWAWNGSVSYRDASDYDIPGFADVDGDEHEEHGEEHEEEEHEEEEHGEEEHGEEHEEHEEEPEFGTLSNSDFETRSLSVGLTRFVGKRGFIGVSFSGFETEYGVPGGGHAHGEEGHDEEHEEDGEEHEEEEHEEHGEEDEHGEGGIRIDMERRRLDLRAEITEPFSIFRGFKARVGIVDYEHAELEGEAQEVGTLFFNDSIDARFEWIQKQKGDLSGSFGLQYLTREPESVGAEAFLPASEAVTLAAFTFQELEKLDGDLRFQFGARYESASVENKVSRRDRSFDGLSASAGLVWVPVDGWAVAFSAAHSTKLPNPEELFSNGPHFATQAFEIGDENLEEETSNGFDFSIRKTTGVLTAELSWFTNDFNDYIFQAFTGEEEDGLDVVRFSQADAEFDGLELKARLSLWERGDRHLDLKLTGDKVNAELDDGTRLPRIPPQRLSLGLHFHHPAWHGYVEVWDVDSVTDVAPNETPTDGHTLVHAGLSYRLLTENGVYDLVLRGRNLTDEDARNHVSFLKDTVPLPGRDISLALRWTF